MLLGNPRVASVGGMICDHLRPMDYGFLFSQLIGENIVVVEL